MDRAGGVLFAVIQRGWLIAGVLGLAPAFFSSNSPADLAIAFGGVLLAYQGLRRFVAGLSQLIGAGLSLTRVAPLFRAAADAESAGEAMPPADAGSGQTVVEVKDLAFRHCDKAEPVFSELTFRIRSGERVLLQGVSGCGKSSLVAVLAGLRQQTFGAVLAGGLDLPTLGACNWRRRIVAAPQYHENHILSATLALNLLLGRGSPPSAADLVDAETVCRELGLGPLLERMPGGFAPGRRRHGMALSQGERRRVFLARALLQNAELIILDESFAILDESFAALDPETLAQALQCAVARAKTLVVVAHPKGSHVFACPACSSPDKGQTGVPFRVGKCWIADCCRRAAERIGNDFLSLLGAIPVYQVG